MDEDADGAGTAMQEMVTKHGWVAVTSDYTGMGTSGVAEYLVGVVADLPPAEAATASMDLVTPVLSEWIAGTMSVAYDDTTDRIVLVIEQALEESDLDPDNPTELPDPSSVRLRPSRGQVPVSALRSTRQSRQSASISAFAFSSMRGTTRRSRTQTTLPMQRVRTRTARIQFFIGVTG